MGSGSAQIRFGGRVTKLSDDARYIARLERMGRERVATRLHELMVDQRLTPPQLSRRSRVAINTVYGALAGQKTPKLGNLLALAAGLGVTLDELLAPSGVETVCRDAAELAETRSSFSATAG